MNKPIQRHPLLISICSVLLFTSLVFAQEKREQDIIRVCVLKDVDSVRLTLDSSYKMYDLRNNLLVKEGKSLYKIKISATTDGLLLGKMPIKSNGIKIISDKDGRIYIDKWRFRGEVDILKTADFPECRNFFSVASGSRQRREKLVVVNHVGVEDYLYGVLYHEVSHYWPYEVLKAQAIVARTYALYQKRIMQGRDYDLTADIYSQVYGGRTSEKYKTNKAVNLTKGKILTYNGDIFPTYYHATCGGFTEDASNLWNIDLAPLKGVECKFCKRSKHFNWKRKIRLDDIEKALNKAGYPVKDITSIKIEGRNKSGRITNLTIFHLVGGNGEGDEFVIAGKDFRIAIGPNLLKSNNYGVVIKDGVAIFKGIGWGHGVGMCQWGAYFMAKKGYKAEQILEYYYPGTKVK